MSRLHNLLCPVLLQRCEIHTDGPGRAGHQIPLEEAWCLTVQCALWLHWARERHRMMKVVKTEHQVPASECWWSGSNLFSLQVIMGREWPEMAPHTHITSPAITPDPDQRSMTRITSRPGHRLLKSSHSGLSTQLLSQHWTMRSIPTLSFKMNAKAKIEMPQMFIWLDRNSQMRIVFLVWREVLRMCEILSWDENMMVCSNHPRPAARFSHPCPAQATITNN